MSTLLPRASSSDFKHASVNSEPSLRRKSRFNLAVVLAFTHKTLADTYQVSECSIPIRAAKVRV
ncbi:hypothetical protein N7456_011288 [Penicillium angulare]|uniref:Uncharacterized protein n=1 Tax=Penicillium angulare TaxID=116970 RepID=A0A9W9ETE0_9EURO|nr:hypothetical protein N7456_011288 [Penicillium angulare]